MTVTALTSARSFVPVNRPLTHPSQITAPVTAPTVQNPAFGPRLSGNLAAVPVNVTIELALPLEHASRELAEALEALRATVQRIGGSRLQVRPAQPQLPQPQPQTQTQQQYQAQQYQAQQQPRPVARAVPPVAPLPQSDDPDQIRILADERRVLLGNEELHLSRLEFDLLLFFASHPRKVLTRRQLLESVWGYTHAGRRTIDVHIRRLRSKFGERPLLTTVRGVGYRLDDEAPITVIHHYAAA
jgi:DNA-binding response OmpR family regulator